MASYPSAKVHRSSRRQLGRGQHVQQPPVTATPVATVAVVVITFSVPVIVNGNLNLNLSTGDVLLHQVVNSPTQITQTYTSTVVGATWSVGPSDPSIATFQGGALAPAGGTF